MTKRIKSTVAAISVFLLLISASSAALAQSFDDVHDDSWYFSYVEQLVAAGVIESGDAYRPDDALTRGELAQMVIDSIDGLNGFVPPTTPTFSDVPANHEYYESIEAAVALNIVSGYTDAEGNLIGIYGPNNQVTRATASKILVNTFDIPDFIVGASVFPDVTDDAWYHDYVVSAYNQSIIDGYDNGYFGPADPVTRAQIAKLIVNAQNPVERVFEEAAGEAEVDTESNGGSLTASLTPVQGPPLTIPIASASPIINVDLTAGDSDVSVSSITLTRGGVGDVTDWYGLYAYEGLFKVTSEYTVNKDTNKVTIPIKLFIGAGTTTTVAVYGDTDVVARPLNQHYFSVESAADIEADAEIITGDFPVVGGVITIGSQYTNTLTIVPGTSLSRPERDQISEVASFKLTSGASSDVAVTVLALTQGGNLSSDKMTDCSLFRGNDVIGTAPGFYQDQVIFALSAPYVVPSGQTRSFTVECYINGGRSTDTIQLYLDEVYDLLTVNTDYGYSAVPLNGYTQALAPSYSLKPAQIIFQ